MIRRAILGWEAAVDPASPNKLSQTGILRAMVMIETSGKRATHCDQPHPGILLHRSYPKVFFSADIPSLPQACRRRDCACSLPRCRGLDRTT